MKKALIDNFGRTLDYLRVSVTDRCNLKCRYCVPEGENPEKIPHRPLGNGAILRVVKVFSDLGVSKVKLTGGEPLLRPDLPELAKGIKEIDGVKSLTLTTNGTLLGKRFKELSESGIDSINVSLDTLNNKDYFDLTRGGDLRKVLKNIELIKDRFNLKINSVAGGFHPETFLPLVNYALTLGVPIRFIELMPIGPAAGEAKPENLEESIIAELERHFGTLSETNERLGNGPARYFKFEDLNTPTRIGFISPVEHSFCDQCTRLRLASNGALKTCLFGEGVDLKEKLENPLITDGDLKDFLVQTVKEKPKAHSLAKKPIDEFRMSDIGG